MIKYLWRIDIHDPTSGYRCYKKAALCSIAYELKAEDQSLILEVLFKMLKKKYNLMEIPIIFEDRKYGISKLTFLNLCNCFLKAINYLGA
jgi:dolichol-phosphate mannosyltransferase